MNVLSTVIVPSHNRREALAETLRHLHVARSRTHFEIVVVDDGSEPPLELSLPDILVVRTHGVERSRARNLGAVAASGERVVFFDDDIAVPVGVIDAHERAAAEFGDVLSVGRVSLPADLELSSFGRFRRSIEDPGQARPRGLVAETNFCTAANMSMRRDTFLGLGGFDPEILSGEDQDLALRFSSAGGQIVFLPEADVLHRDTNADIAAYCRRHEWGARAMAPFLRRYPDRPENRARLRFETGHVTRQCLSQPRLLRTLVAAVAAVQRVGPPDSTLFPMYRVLLGLHLFRGFRKGLSELKNAPPVPSRIDPELK